MIRISPLALALGGACMLAPVCASAQADTEAFLRELVKAPSVVPVSEATRVGWAVSQTTETPSLSSFVTSYAVVGEEGEHWLIEHVNPVVSAVAKTIPGADPLLMALRVRKDDGRVVEAKLGRPGAGPELLEIEIGASVLQEQLEREISPSSPRDPEPLAGEPAQLELAMGTVPCKVYAHPDQGHRIWIGAEGDLRGVLLKFEDSELGSYELSAMPLRGVASLGDETLKTLEFRYSNGDTLLICDDPVVRAFFPSLEGGLLERRGAEFTWRVTERRIDAQPQLRWE